MVSHILSAVFVVVFGLHTAVSQNCGFSRSVDIGERFTIESPNYPNPTPGGLWCEWDLKSPINSIINLNCQDFDIPGCDSICIDSFHLLGSGAWEFFCGKRILELNTTGNRLTASFETESDTMVSPDFISLHSHRKFRCDVTVIEVKTDTPDCGKNNLRSRIVGGEETQLHEWPWQVYMRTSINSTHAKECGGSLISNNWVLTAAHCLRGSVKDDIVLHMGEHDIYSGHDNNHTRTSKVSKIVLYNEYVDIALLQLSNPVEYSHGISPVCLPTNLRSKTFANENVTLAGWGQISSGEPGSAQLLEVDLKVISNSKCSEMSGYYIPDELMCAYDGEGKSSCNGDSGGPLVWLDENGRYQQVGLVVGRFKGHCGMENSPVRYTRVTSYLDWIEAITETSFGYN